MIPELHKLPEPTPVLPSESSYPVAPLIAVHANVAVAAVNVLLGAGVVSTDCETAV